MDDIEKLLQEQEEKKIGKAVSNFENYGQRKPKNVLTNSKLSKQTRKEGYVQTSVNKKILIDSETGETIETVNVVKSGKDINFDRIFLGHIIEAIGEIGNQKIQVLLYLFAVKDSKNLIIKTQKMIAEETGISLRTITQTMKALSDNNFIKTPQRGVYMINPDMIFKGSDDRRMDILLTYREIKETKIDDNPDTFVIDED